MEHARAAARKHRSGRESRHVVAGIVKERNGGTMRSGEMVIPCRAGELLFLGSADNPWEEDTIALFQVVDPGPGSRWP